MRRRIIPRIRVWMSQFRSVPDNEFDPSLEMDMEYVKDLLGQITALQNEHLNYIHDLCCRREAAHQANLKRGP